MHILNEKQIAQLYEAPELCDEERDDTFFLNDKEAEKLLPRESVEIKINYILLLGYFKLNPVRMDIDIDACRADFDYIKAKHFPESDIEPMELTHNQKYKIYSKIFEVTGIQRFEKNQEKDILEFINYVVINHYDAVEIFDEVVDWLRNKNIEIPSYRVLRNFITRAYNEEMQRSINHVTENLSPSTLKSFIKLVKDESSKEALNKILHEARDLSVSEIRGELHVFDTLRAFYLEIAPMLKGSKISMGRIKYYAELWDTLSISRVKIKQDGEIGLYFSCFVFFRFVTLVDYFGDALAYLVRIIEKDGSQYATNKILEDKASMDENLVAAAKILEFFPDPENSDEDHFGKLRAKAYAIISKEDLEKVIAYLKHSKIDRDTHFWEYVDTRKTVVTKTIRAIVLRLDFVDAANNPSLLTQLERTKTDIEAEGEVQWIDDRLFSRVKKYLYDAQHELIPLRAEFAIYRLISGRLERSQWYLANSLSYRPLKEMLIADDVWLVDSKEMVKNTNAEILNKDPHILIPDLLGILKKAQVNVAKRIQTGENESVILEQKDGEFRWTIKRSNGKPAVNHPVFNRSSRQDLASIIYLTARDTGFFDEIKHLTGKKKGRDALKMFIACVIANGTRRGIYEMADLCEFSYETLRTFQANHLRVENLRNASDTISDAIAKLKIFEHYNYRQGYVHASADGQKIATKKSTRRTRFSAKYFGQGKGVYAHTLLANHVPINVKLKGLNAHESHNIFDLLYNNSSDIKVDAVSTDTHGTNRFNFALLGLSDWEFKPRYAQPRGVIESLFEVHEEGDNWTLELRNKMADSTAKCITV